MGGIGMTAILGNLIVVLILGIIVFFAVRALYRSHKNGTGCSCDCGSCGGCGGHCATGKKQTPGK
jgi:hypothetical protein